MTNHFQFYLDLRHRTHLQNEKVFELEKKHTSQLIINTITCTRNFVHGCTIWIFCIISGISTWESAPNSPPRSHLGRTIIIIRGCIIAARVVDCFMYAHAAPSFWSSCLCFISWNDHCKQKVKITKCNQQVKIYLTYKLWNTNLLSDYRRASHDL